VIVWVYIGPGLEEPKDWYVLAEFDTAVPLLNISTSCVLLAWELCQEPEAHTTYSPAIGLRVNEVITTRVADVVVNAVLDVSW
jgi:hypothetical protein